MNDIKMNFRKVLWLISILFALFWGGLYLLLGKLHGMRIMFDNSFPIFAANLFHFNHEMMPAFTMALLVTFDGLIIGLIFSWLTLTIFRRIF